MLFNFGQSGLLNVVIMCLGVYKTPPHINLIQSNYFLLSQKMEPDGGLLSELYSKDVITHREMETIKAGKTFYDRNEELLNVMLHKTEVKFQQFVVALKATNMNEIAGILEISTES